MPRRPFHCFVHAVPSHWSDLDSLERMDRSAADVFGDRADSGMGFAFRHALAVTADEVQTAFPRTFEEVQAMLELLPRMFVEGDGSFVWVIEPSAGIAPSLAGGSLGGETFQIDGVIHDRAGRVIDLELKGMCDQDTLDRILSTVGWPTQPVLMQLVPWGIWVSEQSFRAIFLQAL